MAQIAIIKNTGSYVGNAVLSGVYGSLKDMGPGSEVQQFTVAPEFVPMSMLFEYLENGQSPVKPTDTFVIEASDEQAPVIKDALMLNLEQRWGNMYGGVTPSQPGLMSTMLKSESNRVSRGIAQHFASQGKSRWLVPVKATMKTGADGAYLGTEQELLETLRQNNRVSDVSVVDDMPVRAWADGDAAGVTEAPAAPSPDAPTPAWGEFAGIEADVIGHILVMARNEEDARQACRGLVETSSLMLEQMPSMQYMTVSPVTVTSVRQLTYSDAAHEAAGIDTEVDDLDDDLSDYRFPTDR